MIIITINEKDAFLHFLNYNIDVNDYKYKYLSSVLHYAFVTGQLPVTENTRILRLDTYWAIYIETDGKLFIYGDTLKEFTLELQSIINFESFQGFEIMGDYNLVYSIIRGKNVTNFTVIKDRIFYQLNNKGLLILNSETPLLPKLEDHTELTEMMLDYYVEEYEGKRNKEKAFINAMIIEHIKENSIYILKESQTIVAFCTISDPDIGIIFVRPDFRNRNLGKLLLSQCSKILFDKNQKSFLMTDLNNYSSNKMCLDIGYEEIYKHTNLELI